MDNEMVCGIYRILNTVNNKSYVGQSLNVENRPRQHIANLKNGKHANSHLQSSFDMHGEGKFKPETLQKIYEDDYIFPDLDQDFMDDDRDVGKLNRFKQAIVDAEQYWVTTLNSYRHGYNQTPGEVTTAGIKLSKATRERISEALRRRHVEMTGTDRAMLRDKIRESLQFSEERTERLLAKLELDRPSITKVQYNIRMGQIYKPARWHQMRVEKLRNDLLLLGVTDELRLEHKRLVGNYMYYNSPSAVRFSITLDKVPPITELIKGE